MRIMRRIWQDPLGMAELAQKKTHHSGDGQIDGGPDPDLRRTLRIGLFHQATVKGGSDVSLSKDLAADISAERAAFMIYEPRAHSIGN